MPFSLWWHYAPPRITDRGDSFLDENRSHPIDRYRHSVRVGCPFCWEWIPEPKLLVTVFSGEGCLGGRCNCGAAFAIDETGHSGGQALLDAQALACNGDLDAALALSSGEDYEVKTRPYQTPTRSVGRRPHGHSHMQAKAWFVKLKDKI